MFKKLFTVKCVVGVIVDLQFNKVKFLVKRALTVRSINAKTVNLLVKLIVN